MITTSADSPAAVSAVDAAAAAYAEYAEIEVTTAGDAIVATISDGADYDARTIAIGIARALLRGGAFANGSGDGESNPGLEALLDAILADLSEP